MNFTRADLAPLQLSLIALTLSLLIGGAAILSSAKYVDLAHKEHRQAQRQLIDARKNFGLAQNDLANISIYAREYASLVEYKIIGGEQRLDWMEELAKLHQHYRVTDFKYTIAPQQLFIPNPILDTGNFELKLSGVNLQLDLLHEMQLIDFFDVLRSNFKGWFIIDRCILERNTAAFPAQLKAECSGGWITMKSKAAK